MSLSSGLQNRYMASTYDELATRLSREISTTPCEETLYTEMISRKRFIPAGNTLLAGKQPIRPNCAILPAITAENAQYIVKRSIKLWTERIGIGFDASQHPDPVYILRKLSEANASIDLGHRPQRGNMCVVDIIHPRIGEFITCKSNENSVYSDGTPAPPLYNFNISVGLRKADLTNPLYKDTLALMASSAWKSGDPGIVFLDAVGSVPDELGNGENVALPHLGRATTLVPCGEQAMFPNEVCTLGSLNLACPDFWIPATSSSPPLFNGDCFGQTVKLAVRFLDSVIDQMTMCDPELEAMAKQTRRIGLGIMGFAAVVAAQGLTYNDPRVTILIDQIGSVYRDKSHQASRELAVENGPCPALIGTGVCRRNITVTCIAPTGGITLLTGNGAYGIEPFFTDANKLTISEHMIVQARWQLYVDNCISKTINLPTHATIDDISTAWHTAAEMGLKSVTVYRNGSHLNQPMVVDPSCPSGSCTI